MKHNIHIVCYVFVHILLASPVFTESNTRKVSYYTSTNDSLFIKFHLYKSVLIVEQTYFGESRNQRKYYGYIIFPRNITNIENPKQNKFSTESQKWFIFIHEI